ncbi:MAG: exodeoxyribonuclease VII large subunit [Helicobacter sp.]|nr:exodeoxyribonuclease VII large subunit [Helicobacter sp.]
MHPLSVSELNEQVKSLLEATFMQVCVSGEVSNFIHHTSGHLYFSLKDKDSAIKCVMFKGNAMRLRFCIENGQNITINGAISLYKPRGEYQINCASATPSGLGELTLAYELLKKDYEAKGYFKQESKKKLPRFPKKVALLTSSTGAVLHDMLSIAKKRWNLVEFVLINTLVQGDGAKESIAENIKLADSLGLDCIILARGGGSLEDLWAFNEPLVIEAIFNAKTPLISAIGHEPDFTLSDFVADIRAPTPSGAIEILLPDRVEWLMNLDSLQNSLEVQKNRILSIKLAKLEQYKMLLNKNPVFSKMEFLSEKFNQNKIILEQKMEHKLKLLFLKLESPEQKLNLKIEQKLANFKTALESLEMKLESKNPKNYEKEGFVCALSDGKKIKALKNLKKGGILELQDKTATIKTQIKEILAFKA